VTEAAVTVTAIALELMVLTTSAIAPQRLFGGLVAVRVLVTSTAVHSEPTTQALLRVVDAVIRATARGERAAKREQNGHRRSIHAHRETPRQLAGKSARALATWPSHPHALADAHQNDIATNHPRKRVYAAIRGASGISLVACIAAFS
jgi:hypothetical protein